MAETKPVAQRSFAGGIMSDELIPRSDVAKVAAGVRDLHNFWNTRTGGVQNRPGLRYVQECKDSHDDIQGRTFHFNDAQAYFLEVGTKYIRFYKLAEPTVYPEPPVVSATLPSYYLSNEPDDIGSAISGATGGTQDHERALRSIPGPASKQILEVSTSGGTEYVMYTSKAHSVGDNSASWPVTGDHSVVVKILDFPGFNPSGSSDPSTSQGSASLSARIYRISDGGVVQQNGGEAVEGQVTIGVAGASKPTPATYTFTWSDVAWTGTFEPDDRLGIQLIWTHSPFWGQQLVSYEVSSITAAVSTSVGKANQTTPAGWDETATYAIGDVVAVHPYDEIPETYYFYDDVPSTAPSGAFIGTAADDPFGKIKVKNEGSRGSMFASMGNSQSEIMVIGTNSAKPGWAAWDDLEPFTCILNFSGIGTGPFDSFEARLVHMDTSNVFIEYGLSGEIVRFADGGNGPHTMNLLPPTAGWTSAISTSRLGVQVTFTSWTSGTHTFTLECGSSRLITPYQEDVTQIDYYEAILASTDQNPQASDGATYWKLTTVWWATGDSYVTGDVVVTPAIAEATRRFQLSFEGPSPQPSGFTNVTDDADPYGLLVGENVTATAGSMDMSIIDTATEVMVLITDVGSPAWDADFWPDKDMTVSLAITNQTGTAAGCLVTCAAVRLDEDNALDTGPTYVESASATIATGTLTFTCPIPSDGWGTVAATDRFGIRVTVINSNGVDTVTFDLECADAASFVTTPYVESGDGFDFWYCTADHSGKDPRELRYQDDFWYALPENADGQPLLEIPTPFVQADLSDLDFNQSGNIITITHRNYPPHELVRYADTTYSFGRWTCLPIAFKPQHPPPTGITADDTGAAGERNIRYKVTAVSDDSGSESNAGTFATTDTGTVTNVESATLDLSVLATTHGLLTGDDIGIESVATQDSERAHQNAVEQLAGTTWIVDRTDADNFTLRDSAGLLSKPSTASSDESYPDISITFAKAYIEFASKKIPKGDGAKMLSFNWTAVAGTREYWVYRQVASDETATGTIDDGAIQEWGFLASTSSTAFFDSGGDADQSSAVADDESPPPEYSNPFRAGDRPRASAYHQQRQFFAGTADHPLRVWASSIGDFRNFVRHFPTQDDDRVQFDISSEEANEVQVMRPLGQIMIFTTGGILTLQGDRDGTITPAAPNPVWLASEGAATVRPIPSDDVLLYVQTRGSYLREVSYDVGNGGFAGYAGRDLTVFAPDLFRGFTLNQIARASIPHSIAWCVRSDGTLLGLSLMREQELWGWHRHTTLNGEFLSVATVPEQNEDVLYTIVKRTLTAGTKYYVERMDVRKVGRTGIDLRKEMFFLDSGISYDGTHASVTTMTLTGGTTWASGETGLTLTASVAATFVAGDVGNGYRILDSSGNEAEVEVTAFSSGTAVTVTNLTAIPSGLQGVASTTSWVKMLDDITGLDHLEGDVVYALADANVLGPFTVASGAIDLGARPYGQVHVGLRITADMELMDVEAGDDVIARRRHVPIITSYLHETRRLQAGPTSSDLIPLDPDDDGTRTIDTYSNLVSEKKTTRMKGAVNLTGRVLFRQVDPLPATVTGVVRHIEIGEV